MVDKQSRVAVREIQQELKKPLAPEVHKIRELPGTSDLYIYLPWEVVRDKVEEVYPEYEFTYTLPQYSHENNEATCIVTLTIEGIRKQALASCSIALISSKGKDMARGSCADRLHAEAIKNGAEAWGVGRYLSNQEFCFRYLWENKAMLDKETSDKLMKMQGQFRSKMQAAVGAPVPDKPAKPKKEVGFIDAVAGNNTPNVSANTTSNGARTISDAQAKRLWGIARGELKLEQEAVKKVYKSYGFQKTEDITVDKYEAIIEELRKINSQVATLNGLFPKHQAFLQSLVAKFNIDNALISNLFSRFQVKDASFLNPEKLKEFTALLAGDYAVSIGSFVSPENAITSYDGKVSFFEASGQTWGAGVLDWFNQVQYEVFGK